MRGVRSLRVAPTPWMRCKARTSFPVASPQPPRQSHCVDTRLHCAPCCKRCQLSDLPTSLESRGLDREAKAGRGVGRVAGTRFVYRKGREVV
jgi:hypothetical protein